MKFRACVFSILLSMFIAAPTFAGQFRKPVLYTVGTEPQQVIAADFNHDGNLDLVVILDLVVLEKAPGRSGPEAHYSFGASRMGSTPSVTVTLFSPCVPPVTIGSAVPMISIEYVPIGVPAPALASI